MGGGGAVAMSRPVRAWTDAETSLLFRESLLDNRPYGEIAVELKREPWDVEKKARNLRLPELNEVVFGARMTRVVRAASDVARETGHCAVCGQAWTPSAAGKEADEGIVRALLSPTAPGEGGRSGIGTSSQGTDAGK